MVYAISDLHLNTKGDKPMAVFGGNWADYLQRIRENWLDTVKEEDIVLIAGDISWAMSLEEALLDMEYLNALSGTKVIIRGNHDYWWNSYAKLQKALPPNILAIQNNCIRIGDILICGTRGWTIASEKDTEENQKIYKREIIRLEIALEDMKKQRKDKDIVLGMMHYPPFGVNRTPSEFSKLFSKYEVQKVVYGHLHGKDAYPSYNLTLDNVDYYLTSCDLVNNTLIKIIP